MERRPDIGLDSYDRLFPNQDTMPQGGFGNLIALPLQKRPREQGNSVFLDDDLVPYADQWAFLASVRQDRPRRRSKGSSRTPNDAVASSACGCRHRTTETMSRGPLHRHAVARSRRSSATCPRALELVLGNQIYIAKDGLHPGLRNRLLRLAAFQNPEFYKAQAMRLSTYDKPRIIACAEDHPHHIGLPRGCLDDVRQALTDLGVRSVIRDERYAGRPLDVSFHGELRPEQQAAADAMLAHDTGVLAATTAFGKTVVAAWLIAQRGVNTLVLVHRRQLLDQWVERLSAFLGHAGEVDRSNRRRAKPADRAARRRRHSEPRPEGRRRLIAWPSTAI